MTVLVPGELNVDLVLRDYRTFPSPGREILVDDMSLSLGSASAICAAGLAKLGHEVLFVGKVGEDAYGELCVSALEELGVDCSRVQRDPRIKTGITVSVTSAADRALITYLGASAELGSDDIEDEALQAARHLHVSSFFLQRRLRPGLKGLFSRAHALGLTTSLDPGFDPMEQWESDLLATLSEVDIFLPNEVELRAVSGVDDPEEALARLDNGRTITVAKLGRAGAVTRGNGRVERVPSCPVQPIDTTGAGDSFNAGFLHAWLRGDSVREAIRFGAACGAISTLGIGGTSHQATERDAEELLASQHTLARTLGSRA